MKKIFLDTNIALEILLERKNKPVCIEYLQNIDGIFCLSSLSVHIIYYVSFKHLSKKSQIFEYLDQFKILDLSSADYEVAKKIIKDSDFEDVLQIACALRHGCQNFITLDQKLKKTYSSLLDIDLIGMQS